MLPFSTPWNHQKTWRFFLFFQGVEKGWIGNKWDDETFSKNNSIIDGWRPKYVLESIGLCVRREYIFSFTNSCLACCSPRNSSFPWTLVFVCVCVCVCVFVYFFVCVNLTCKYFCGWILWKKIHSNPNYEIMLSTQWLSPNFASNIKQF